MADYLEEENDFELDIDSDVVGATSNVFAEEAGNSHLMDVANEVVIATTDQRDEEETDDPMDSEMPIPLDMEDEAFYYCTGYLQTCKNYHTKHSATQRTN